MPRANILVVDDDAAVCWALERALRQAGYEVAIAASLPQVERCVQVRRPELALIDWRMPGLSGETVLRWLRERSPALPTLVMTAYGTVEVTVAALQVGARDVLVKPLDLDQVLSAIARHLGHREVALAIAPRKPVEPHLVGTSVPIRECCRRIGLAALNRAPVLLLGPSGSGRSLAAHLIHRYGAGTQTPWLTTEGAELPSDPRQLLAVGRTASCWYIRELDRASVHSQRALLQCIDTGALPCRLLASAADERALTPELAMTVASHVICLPALAAIREDIPLIAAHLLARWAARAQRAVSLTEDALEQLSMHTWPGNVRELARVLETAAASATDGCIDRGCLPLLALRSPQTASPALAAAQAFLRDHAGQAYERWLEHWERPLLSCALMQAHGNLSQAASALGVHRGTLRRRLQRLGMDSALGSDDTASEDRTDSVAR